MAISLDRIAQDPGGARWYVRFFVGPGATGDPDPASVPLDLTIAGDAGEVAIRGYESGPPGGPYSEISGPLTVMPCRAVVLVLETDVIGDGAYEIRMPEVRRPEGDVVTERIIVAEVDCEPVRAGAETECINPRGTGPRTLEPVPTSSPRPGGTP